MQGADGALAAESSPLRASEDVGMAHFEMTSLFTVCELSTISAARWYLWEEADAVLIVAFMFVVYASVCVSLAFGFSLGLATLDSLHQWGTQATFLDPLRPTAIDRQCMDGHHSLFSTPGGARLITGSWCVSSDLAHVVLAAACNNRVGGLQRQCRHCCGRAVCVALGRS